MIFTNALPCSLDIEITQPPVVLRSQEEENPIQHSELAPRELFFLPNDLHHLSRDINIYTSSQPTQISWQPFENDDMVNSFSVFPGSSWNLPCFLDDRDLYIRVSIAGTNLWSKVYVFCRDILSHRSTYRKHKPEDLSWNYSRRQDITLERGPQVKFKRVWKIIREIVFFSEFWIVNKTGLACFYETKPPKDDEKAVDFYDEYKTLMFTQTEYSDTIQKQFMRNLSVPVLLSCPNRRLRIMPYCMIQDLDKNNFYLYDLWSYSRNSYLIRTKEITKIYSDADWQVTSTPSMCGTSKNFIYLQTPNADRTLDPFKENCLSFKISSNCFVSICVDTRCRTIPPWMKTYGFSSTGERIHTTNPNTVYQVYRRFFRGHDCIKLGGNGVKIADDSRCLDQTIDMYLIFITECPSYYCEPTIASISLHDSVWRPFFSESRFALKPNIKIGDNLYLDREDISMTLLPSILSKIPLLGIQTFIADKSLTYKSYFDLTIQHPSRLFLCLDSNIDIDEYPRWISESGFEMTNLQINSREHRFILFCRQCGAEKISIGTLSTRLKSVLNYFLLLADEQEFLQASAIQSVAHAATSSAQSVIGLTGNDLAYAACNDPNQTVVFQEPKFDDHGRQWSSYFDVAPGNSGELCTTCGYVSVQVSLLPGLFHRTSVVTLFPRFIVVNQLPINVEIHPFMSSFPPTTSSTVSGDLGNSVELSPRSSGVIYSFTQLSSIDSSGKKSKRWICLRESSSNSKISLFSRPISLDDLGEINLWLQIGPSQAQTVCSNHEMNSRLLISANVMLQDNFLVLTLKDNSNVPPYRLENRSFSHALEYRQRSNTFSPWRILLPGTWESFVWDDPYGSKYLEFRLVNSTTVSEPICLDEIGRIPNFYWNSSYPIDLSTFLSSALKKVNDEIDESFSISSGVIGGYVYANGITRVLILNEISAKRNSLNLFDFLRCNLSLRKLKSTAQSFFDAFLRSLNFSSKIRGIHFNIFSEDNDNNYIQEILGINIEGILFNFSNDTSCIDFSVYHFQFDDMRKYTRFPVIINPANSGYNSHLGEDDDNNIKIPFLQCRCQWKSGSLSTDILHLSEFQIIMQPINLKVDMELIVYLVKIIGKIVKEMNIQFDKITPEVASKKAAIECLSQTINPSIIQTFLFNSKKPIYIELFHYGSLIIFAEVGLLISYTLLLIPSVSLSICLSTCLCI